MADFKEDKPQDPMRAPALRQQEEKSVDAGGSLPVEVGAPQEPHARQAQTVEPKVNSLAWSSGIIPPDPDHGVPEELRTTPPSGVTSEEPILPSDPPPRTHRQTGVSPGNAESEDFDWEHPYGG